MGSFYCNATVIGSSLEEVAAAVTGPALLTVDGDCVVVFSPAEDEGMPVVGIALSNRLSAPVLSVGVHDDDILFIQLCLKGDALIEGAVPDPAEYFGGELDEMGISPPSLSASALVNSLGRGNLAEVEKALVEDFVFATERHEALARALALPPSAVGWGHRYLSEERDHYEGPPLHEIAG